MQQTLVGCAFCDAPPGTETGEAHTWGQDELVTHPTCVDCAIQKDPGPMSAIMSSVTAVGWSSIRSRHSFRSGWNSVSSAVRSNSAFAVAPTIHVLDP